MKAAARLFTALALALFLLPSGCERETDITSSPEYGFASIAGTTWETKVKLAIGEVKGFVCLLGPDAFDSTRSSYTPPPGLKIITIVPVGTRVRIDRLMKNNGGSGLVRVAATIWAENQPERSVYLSNVLVVRHSTTTWKVDPEMLAPVTE